MLRKQFHYTAMLITVAVISSCSKQVGRLPTAPTVASLPTAVPAPGAIAMTLGQPITETLTAADPPCGIQVSPGAPEPCRRFAVSVTRPGLLKVRLTSPGPDELTLRVGTSIYWGTTVNVSAAVQSGSTYEISVALHSRKGSQAFELIATLEPS